MFNNQEECDLATHHCSGNGICRQNLFSSSSLFECHCHYQYDWVTNCSSEIYSVSEYSILSTFVVLISLVAFVLCVYDIVKEHLRRDVSCFRRKTAYYLLLINACASVSVFVSIGLYEYAYFAGQAKADVMVVYGIVLGISSFFGVMWECSLLFAWISIQKRITYLSKATYLRHIRPLKIFLVVLCLLSAVPIFYFSAHRTTSVTSNSVFLFVVGGWILVVSLFSLVQGVRLKKIVKESMLDTKRKKTIQRKMVLMQALAVVILLVAAHAAVLGWLQHSNLMEPFQLRVFIGVGKLLQPLAHVIGYFIVESYFPWKCGKKEKIEYREMTME